MKTLFKKYRIATLAIIAAAAASVTYTSCSKVDPMGVLMAGTAVDDRVKMSLNYWNEFGDYFDTTTVKNYKAEGIFDDKGHLVDIVISGEPQDYSFLIGADSHTLYDTGRLREMFEIARKHGDFFCANLGDIAETQPQYYSAIKRVQDFYADKKHGGIPFFVVPGNHDITRNGWALFTQVFKASFYDFWVLVDIENNGHLPVYDHFIFLDTASGTLGKEQIDAIESGALLERQQEGEEYFKVRHRFLFTHTNFFRPRFTQFSSTFCREEMYFLLNKAKEWNTTMVFTGHVHAWDYRVIGGVEYLTFDSMGERNSPNPGDYLVRVNITKDGKASWEKVRLNYVNNSGYAENDYHHLQWEVDSGLRPFLSWDDFMNNVEDDASVIP
ncbi:MAG: metallophosphoesterase [Bacteroidales bacterium]|nr:metallophosphoesterase [Bacteroidales bacterium]